MICQLSIIAEFNGDVFVNFDRPSPLTTICVSGNYNAQRICLAGSYKAQNAQAFPTKRPVVNTNYTNYLLTQTPIFTDY